MKPDPYKPVKLSKCFACGGSGIKVEKPMSPYTPSRQSKCGACNGCGLIAEEMKA